MRKPGAIRARAAPPCGWPSAPRRLTYRTIESSPTRGGETEPPPPRGSRRLRDRARHFAAPGAQAVHRARARAGPRAPARRRIRPAAARGEHLGAAYARREHRRAQARPARARSAPGAHRAAGARAVKSAKPVNAGPVRLPVWRARFVMSALLVAFAVLAGRSLYLQTMHTDFLQGKGDARYSRVIEMPATRG